MKGNQGLEASGDQSPTANLSPAFNAPELPSNGGMARIQNEELTSSPAPQRPPVSAFTADPLVEAVTLGHQAARIVDPM